jgi:hypothetical protein
MGMGEEAVEAAELRDDELERRAIDPIQYEQRFKGGRVEQINLEY